MMKVLIVGAGAVGQVYGHHLGKAGDDVTFFVRPKYRAGLESGLTMYPSGFRGRTSEPLSTTNAIDSVQEVAAGSWDEVWLAVSATAIRGEWLDELLAAAGEATIVTLQPGIDTRGYLLERVATDRLVSGAIPFIAWQAPLPGETLEPAGIQYVFPPFSKTPLSGPTEARDSIISRLRRGGCPAKSVADAARWAANPSAIMMPHIAGLEIDRWSLRGFRRGNTLRTSVTAAKEALTITAAHYGESRPLAARLLAPWLMRIVLWSAARLAPFDLETYLAYHFTKVGDQTRAMLDTYRERAARIGLQSPGLDALRQGLSAEPKETD